MSEYVFKLPDLGEGTVEAEIAEWMVKVGDMVEEEDPIGAMLTDKAAVEVSAPVSGKVVSLAGEPGDVIAVGSPLVVFETSGSAEPAESSDPEPEPAATPEPEPKPAEPPAPQAAAPAAAPLAGSGGGKVMTSPSIRHQAKEAGVDLGQVRGSGPRGRILKADFEAFLAGAPATVAARPQRQPAGETEEIKVVGMRRIIAQRMTAANSEVPHFAYVEEIDVTALESLRAHLNGLKSAGEAKLNPLPFICLALARALAEFPQCNAHYDAERNVIIRHSAVHLGIATQTGDGLKVPVVRHCEARGLEDLAGEIRRVSDAARNNTAQREELSGSTITVTSLGKLGGIVTTPIINQPEVGIIGVNKAVDRPVVENGQIVVRRMMNLSSSFDHRFVDGYDAAQMIQAVKGYLEQPATIFMYD